jgi:hypothetical protein
MSLKICFVTCSIKPDFAIDDLPAVELLMSMAVAVRPLPWDVYSDDWNSFDLVVIRSCWNYHLYPEEFAQWLDLMESRKVKLLNKAKTVRWNYHKGYLKVLHDKGVPIPPTLWINKGSRANIFEIFKQNQWDKAVVKPAISATAHNTFVVSFNSADPEQNHFSELLGHFDLLVQKFMPEVKQEGEWSLIFFNKKFSHAVIKRPKARDFRVQNDFGGTAEAASPPLFVLKQAEKILALIKEPLLYARVDGVVSNNQFLLMELELIEPMLFLKEGNAASKFADVTMKAAV